MKLKFLFLYFAIFLILFGCGNPLIKDILQPKTVIFNSMGGSAVKSQTVYRNEKVSEPVAPARANHVFGGWYKVIETDNESSENFRWDFNDIVTEDMTLYAWWNHDGTGGKPTPTADDFIITNLEQMEGNVTAVDITPREDKSNGDITIYYNGSTTLPTTVGEYPVTFDITETENWSEANGLSAGTLVINIPAFDSVTNLAEYLVNLQSNSADTPQTIFLNVSSLADVAQALNNAPDKYVILDLSGSNINEIGENAFINCANLIGITIPDSVTSIGSLSFYNCTSLTSITIPNSVESIGESAFSGCTSFTNVTIPNSVTSIGRDAFFGCTSLTSVTIPNSVTAIENNIFNNCTGLISINVDNSNTTYSSDNGVLYNKGKTSLIAYPAGKTESSFVIPDSVTSMEDYAFRGCTSLKSITIPDKITGIANWAFIECTSLTSVTFEGTINSFGINAFPGDLANKYSVPNGGGPGTYTTANPGYNAVWAKGP